MSINNNEFLMFFSKLVGEEDSRVQGAKGSSEYKRLDTDYINTYAFSVPTL